MLERVLSSDYVSSIFRAITQLPSQFARQSPSTMIWLFREIQTAIQSLFSLFAVAQITREQLRSLQSSLHSLETAGCVQCGHVYALLHCLLFATLLDQPLLDSALHPRDKPVSLLPLLTDLMRGEPSTLSFALGLALLREDSSSSCVLAVSAGLNGHELRRIQSSIVALSFVDLPPPMRSQCLTFCYRILIVFIERYVLVSCPLASLKSLQEQYSHLTVAPPSSAFPDGVETLIDVLCTLLPLLDAPLQNAPIDSLLLFLLDRLAVQPCFFDCTLRLLTAIAELSPQSAAAAHHLLLSYDSPMISWQLLLSSLQQAMHHILQPRAAPLCPDDVSGIASILQLMAALLQDPQTRLAVLQEDGFNLLALSLKLLPQKLPLALLGALCRVLARCAEDPAGTRAIWSHLETFCTAYGAANRSTGAALGAARSLASLRAAFQNEETSLRDHPLSAPFLELLRTVLEKLPFAQLQRSQGLFALLEFVVQDVLLGCQPQAFREESEYWRMLASALHILRLCVHRLAETPDLATDAGSCIGALVAELVVPSPLLRRVLYIQGTDLPLFPTTQLAEGSREVANAIAAASLLLLELLKLPSSLLDALQHAQTATIRSSSWRSEGSATAMDASRGSAIRSFAQQLLAEPSTTIHLLMQLCYASQPTLQCVTLEILSLLAAQISPVAFVSFFGAFGEELALLRTACKQIWTRALQLSARGESDAMLCARFLLQMLSQQASASPSLTSLLLDLPSLLYPHGFIHDSFLARLCSFLTTPSLVQQHAQLAVDVLHLLEQLASPAHQTGKTLLQSLAASDVASKLLAMLPFLLEQAQSHAADDELALQAVCSICRLLSTLLFAFHNENRPELVREVLLYFAVSLQSVADAFPNPGSLVSTPIEHLLSALRGFALTEIPMGFIPEEWVARCETSVSTFGCSVRCLDLSKLQSLAEEASQHSASQLPMVQKVMETARQANAIAQRSALEKQTFHCVLSLLQIAFIDCQAFWNGLLPSSLPFSAESLPSVVIHSLFSFLAQSTPSNLLRPEACEVAIVFLRLVASQQFSIDAPQRHQLLENVLSCILNDPLRQTESARSAQYLLLLQLLLYLKKSSPQLSLRELFTPTQLALPALLELLAHDMQVRNAALHSAAAALLRLFIAEDVTESITHYLLSQTSLLSTLLQIISQLDLSYLENPASTHESLDIVTQSLSLLAVLVRSTEGAMTALDFYLFECFNHCPLIQSLRENGTSLSLLQTDKVRPALQDILKLFLQIILSVEATVRPIRSVQSELTAFILAIAPLTSFLFRIRKEHLMDLEVLGLFLGALVVLANQPERLVEMMNGYEGVLKTEVVRLLNYVSKKEKVCRYIQNSMRGMETAKLHSEKKRLYKVLVENGMLFMSKMGWKIGDEYLRAFGVKY